MERPEILSILNVIRDTYDVQFTELTMEVWFNALKEFDVKDVKKATFEYIRTGKYKPKPADIIDLIINSKVPGMTEEISAQEAWSMVYKAMCNSTYNAESEFNKLPELVQKAVGTPSNLRNYAMDDNFNMGVAQSNFFKAYNTLLERKKNDYALKLEDVRRGRLSIEQLTSAMIANANDAKPLLIENNIK